jgi:hypothetical protein
MARVALDHAAGVCAHQGASALLRATPRAPAPGALAVAMHVRRGDSCMRWTEWLGDEDLWHGGRPCFATSLYVDAALRLKAEYGASVVRLATDSADAAHEITSRLQGQMHVEILPFDRLGVGGESSANLGKHVNVNTTYIEDRLRRGDPTLDRGLAITSLFAELQLLASADMLIGTSTSWVTRLAFFAMVGASGVVPPHIFLDAPLYWIFDRGVRGIRC